MLARYTANVFKYSFLAASVFFLYTSLCSCANASHIDATIVDTSPNDAFGFCPLIAACVSRKNNAYADTGFVGSFGSFFFFFRGGFGFFGAVTDAFPPFDGDSFNGSGEGRFNVLTLPAMSGQKKDRERQNERVRKKENKEQTH